MECGIKEKERLLSLRVEGAIVEGREEAPKIVKKERCHRGACSVEA